MKNEIFLVSGSSQDVWLKAFKYVISLPAILSYLLPMASKANKLSLNTEPIAHENNTHWKSKPGSKLFYEALLNW